MKPLTHHIPLRGNMQRCLEHAANPQRKTVFTRTEIIRAVRNDRTKKNWLAERREKLFPTAIHKRIANVRALPSIQGFHVIGFGRLPQISNGELKSFLRANGFTGTRRGGLVSKL